MKNLFLVAFIFIFQISCKKSVYNRNHVGSLDYFGLEKGLFVEFEVISIEHIPLTSSTIFSDTNHYFVKHVIKDSIMDITGNWAYEFHVLKKDSIDGIFQLSDVYTANHFNDNCELVVENERIIKLKSPIKINNSWNPNIYNTLPLEKYEYENINESFIVGNLSFDSTVTVVQCNERNLVRFCKKEEIYAKNIGMIYKYFKDLEISNFDTLNIKSGLEFYYKPISYGYE